MDDPWLSTATDGLSTEKGTVVNNTPIEYKIAAILFRYYAIVLLIIGLFGNTMTFIVFSRKGMKGSVTSFLFRMLAVADTFVCLVTNIPEVMLELAGTSAAYATDPQCKVHGYIFFAGKTYAVWALLLIVLERFIGITFPHKASSLITFKRAKMSVGILFIIIYALYAPLLFVMSATEIYDTFGNIINYYCEVSSTNLPYFVLKFFPWFDLLMYCVIPFILMIIANICIIYKLVLSSRMRQETTRDSSQSDVRGTTIMLLGISFGFIICTGPYCVSSYIYTVYGTSSPKHYLFGAFASVLVNMNHCINFYIYCLTGTLFRREVHKMFGCHEPNNTTLSSVRNGVTSRSDTVSTKACTVGT